jgi:hypothetical protein
LLVVRVLNQVDDLRCCCCCSKGDHRGGGISCCRPRLHSRSPALVAVPRWCAMRGGGPRRNRSPHDLDFPTIIPLTCSHPSLYTTTYLSSDSCLFLQSKRRCRKGPWADRLGQSWILLCGGEGVKGGAGMSERVSYIFGISMGGIRGRGRRFPNGCNLQLSNVSSAREGSTFGSLSPTKDPESPCACVVCHQRINSASEWMRGGSATGRIECETPKQMQCRCRGRCTNKASQRDCLAGREWVTTGLASRQDATRCRHSRKVMQL